MHIDDYTFAVFINLQNMFKIPPSELLETTLEMILCINILKPKKTQLINIFKIYCIGKLSFSKWNSQSYRCGTYRKPTVIT